MSTEPMRRSMPMPFEKTLPGFDGVLRYYDPRQGRVLAKILPGEYYLTHSREEHIVTTLGSCVSACIRDPEAQVGGMNHFMLPGTPRDEEGFSPSSANRYGVFAMESLVNSILTHGGDRRRLEIKVTGGGRVAGGPGSIGDMNVQFIRRFLEIEGLRPVSVDLGGLQARRVHYDPWTGRLRVKKLASLQRPAVLQEEERYRESLNESAVVGTVELFREA